MNYSETLEGPRTTVWQCPHCGNNGLEVEVDDSGWDDNLENYVEYARVRCDDCDKESKVRIVYSMAEWITGWGNHPEE